MPTYEYRCKDCGHTFDVYQSFADDALTECPECAGTLKKLFGNVGISFKGSGFYKNDSRSGSSAGASSSPGSSPAPSGASSADGGSTGSGSSAGSDPSSGSTSTNGSSDTSSPSTSTPAATSS